MEGLGIQVNKKCKRCSNIIKGSPKYIAARTFCSNQCRAEDKKSKRITFIKCLHCLKEFRRREKRSRFCSSSCSAKHYPRNTTKVILQCKECKETFTVYRYRSKIAQCCGGSCSSKYNLRKYGNTGRASKWSVELADRLFSVIPIQSRTHGKEKSFRNEKGGYYLVDIFFNNRVIECNGDYWHCNDKIFKKYHFDSNKVKEYNNNRKQYLKEQYELQILEIWESDYKKDKEAVIQECIQFLQTTNG